MTNSLMLQILGDDTGPGSAQAAQIAGTDSNPP